MMESFKKLMEITDILNSPEGCPWDLKQTFSSLRPYVLEEAHEVLEAVDKGDEAEIIEELGDLFYTVVFYAKVAEREKRFSMNDVIKGLIEKLIRRHPHVFGEKKANSMEEIVETWKQIKSEEKKDRKNPMDGVPKTLPSLMRAQKMCKRLTIDLDPMDENREQQLALQIFSIVKTATKEEIDIESAFREFLYLQEKNLYPI